MDRRGQSAKKVLCLADIGGPAHWHVGDEAIGAARLAWWRRSFPFAEPIMLSEDPAHTAARHGVAAVAEPALPSWVEEGSAYFTWCRHFPRAATDGLSGYFRRRDPVAHAALQALRQCAMLHICGGGNLTSRYRRLLRLRSLFAMHALAHGIPVVLTGIQLGPDLSAGDRKILRAWLPQAAVVGVRDDQGSRRLALELGVPAARLLVSGDDALDLEDEPVPDGMALGRGPRPLIGLCLHREKGIDPPRFVARMAEVLAPWLASSGADIVFIPHQRSERADRDDAVLARELAQALGPNVVMKLVDGLEQNVRRTKFLTGRCQFLLTTRFHGAVFALSSGVPVFGVFQDDYGRQKLQGLFAYFGLQDRTASWLADDLREKVGAAWEQRDLLAREVRAGVDRTMPKFAAARAQIRAHVESLLSSSAGACGPLEAGA